MLRQERAASAASRRSNKQQQATAVFPALPGIRWNQRHHNDKVAPIIFVVLFVHDQVEQHIKLNIYKGASRRAAFEFIMLMESNCCC